MYIIELLIKKLFHRKPKQKELEELDKKCEHVFLPIDKSGKRLACTKCGQFATLE